MYVVCQRRKAGRRPTYAIAAFSGGADQYCPHSPREVGREEPGPGPVASFVASYWLGTEPK